MRKFLTNPEDTKVPWILLSIFLLAGLALRLYQLGKFGFWTDELLHVIGANSLLEAGTAVVPGKGEYTRAYPITWLTAMMFKYFGESESIARVPYVVVNTLFVFIGFILVKKIFDVKIALIFSFIMAFSPFEISMSRECRMYAVFQMLYFSGSMMFIAGMEPKIMPERKLFVLKKVEDMLNVNIYYLLISLLLLLGSAYFHALSYNFVFVAITYLLLMAILGSFRNGLYNGILSKYSLFLLTIAVLFLSLFLYSPGYIYSEIEMASSLPEWAGDVSAYSYYWKFFVKNYPFFIYAYLLSIFIAIQKYEKYGIYLLASFVPILIMHSFVYTGRVSERYIFYIFPYFVLGSSFIVCACIDHSKRLLQEYYSKKSYLIMATLIVCMIPAFYLIGKPWINDVRRVHDKYSWSDWKSASKDLKNIPKDAIVIATRINNVYYYLGRMPNYNVRKSLFEITQKDVQLGNKTLSLNYIMDKDMLEHVSKSSKDVYFLGDRWSYNLPGYMDDDMRKFINSNYVFVPHSGNNSIIIMKYTGGN